MASEGSSVSFVVPCYRNLRTVGFTLRSILAQEHCSDPEIILVDSSEESVSDWVNTHFPGVRLLRPGRRLWAGSARNLGASRAEGDLLAFVDADAVLRPNWLPTLRKRLEELKGAVVTGGYVENANPGTLPSRMLHWIEFSEFLPGAPSGLRRFLSSSNLLLRRNHFLETGGFPEHLPASEDRLFFHDLLEGGQRHAFWDGSTGILHYHRSHWNEALGHLYHLGYWGGRVRREQPALRGGRLGGVPSAALVLPLYRAPLIIMRACRARPRNLPGAIALSPLMLLALTSWARGFRAGLKASRERDEFEIQDW
jgi:glycosyltransferase involved in cell wall biosynthesis